MEAVRIFIALILLTAVSGSLEAEAKTSVDSNFVIGLIDTNLESVRIDSTSNQVFVLMNEKRCSKCFVEVCEFLSSKCSGNYKVNAVFCSTPNISAVLSRTVIVKDEFPCQENILFRFLDQNSLFLNSPTPQLLFYSNSKFRYFSYEETLKMISKKEI